MKSKNQKALPPPDNSRLVKRGAWELEDSDEIMYTLEFLMSMVSQRITEGEEITDVLRRRQLPRETLTNKQFPMTDEQYNDYLSFYQTRTSKGYNPAIGIRQVFTDLWDTIYLITRSPDKFPGKALRLVSVVETCMIHVGLHGLDLMIVGRPKIVRDRINLIWKGGKKKRLRLKPPLYRFVNFLEKEDKQQNIWCLSRDDFARAATIAEDYGWDFGFVIQIAMIIAIASSETLPEDLRNDAIEEVEYFKEYLNKVY